MRDETYGGALYPPNKEPLIIRCNRFSSKEEMEKMRKTFQTQLGDNPLVLLPWDCEVVMPSKHLSPCDVCRYNPPSSTDGKPCSVCPAEGRIDG